MSLRDKQIIDNYKELLNKARSCIEKGQEACFDDPPGDWIDIMEDLVRALEKIHEK